MRTIIFVCLLLSLAACAAAGQVTREPRVPTVVIRPAQTPTNQTAATPDNSQCAETASINRHISTPDGKLSMDDARPFYAGGQKVGWTRPAGSTLEVTGRRLDAEAPPPYASLPCCYPTTFQASGLYFPTEGCWEVEASAEEHTLRFIVRVFPYPNRPLAGSCDTLADVGRISDMIMVATVLATKRDPRGTAWHEAQPERILWENRAMTANDLGDRFSMVQNTNKERLLQKDGVYLLFLQAKPWHLVCAERTLAETKIAIAAPLTWLGTVGGKPLWSSTTVDALEKEVRALLPVR